MSTYFIVIFAVHHMVFRYDVYFEEYIDLSLRVVSGNASKDIEPMRRAKKKGSRKKIQIII